MSPRCPFSKDFSSWYTNIMRDYFAELDKISLCFFSLLFTSYIQFYLSEEACRLRLGLVASMNKF
jgi:hypothetical protein